MKKIIALIGMLIMTHPAQAETTFGSSCTRANPSRPGEINTGLRSSATGQVDVCILGTNTTKFSATQTATPAIISTGTKFTISGCSAGTTVGGATAGTFVSGTTGTCTVTITMNGAAGSTATTGWACYAANRTTANLIRQTASTATTATLEGVTVTSDVISFGCTGY